MEPYQQRVVDEQIELVVKLNKLEMFIDSNNPIFGKLSEDEQGRLIKQCGLMAEYSAVLADRIKHFTEAK